MFHKRKNAKDGLRSECKDCRKEYQQANKEMITKYCKEYREAHKKYIVKYKEKYHIANKEKIILYTKKYYEANKESVSKYGKEYRKINKAKCNIFSQRYRAKKRELPHSLDIRQWDKIKKDFNNKCAYCGKKLPLEQEHFIPLSKDGEYTINNIIPSCRSCNSSKSNKGFFEWYRTHESYSKKREKFILQYLHYENGNQQLTLTI